MTVCIRRRVIEPWLFRLPALLLLVPGCAELPDPAALHLCPVRFVSTDELPAEMELRARLRISRGKDTSGFDLFVTRKGGGKLHFVGKTPTGRVQFEAVQSGAELKVLRRGPREHVPPPEWVADALHRALWIQRPQGVRSGPDGSWQRGVETITDLPSGGPLQERIYTRSDDRGRVRIGYGSSVAPVSASIASDWCGYVARYQELLVGSGRD